MATGTKRPAGKTVGRSNQEAAALWRIMATNQRRESSFCCAYCSSQWLFPFALPALIAVTVTVVHIWYKYWVVTAIWWYNPGLELKIMMLKNIHLLLWSYHVVSFCLWRTGLVVWSSFSLDKPPIYLVFKLSINLNEKWLRCSIFEYWLLDKPPLMGGNYRGPKQALHFGASALGFDVL